jgi:hypothetical protein
VKHGFWIGLALRLGVAAFALAAAQLPGPAPHPRASGSRAAAVRADLERSEPWMAGLYRWDAVWCADVALRGYALEPDEDGYRNTGFQPVVPAAINNFGYTLTGILAAVFSAWAISRTADNIRIATYDADLARRTFWLLHLFPSACFFSFPYHEGIAALAVATVVSKRIHEQSSRAFAPAGLGVLAKSTGLACAAAAFAEWLLVRPRPSAKLLLWVLLGCTVGLLIFAFDLYLATGDPLANTRAHAAWGRSAPSPHRIPAAVVDAFAEPKFGELATCALFLALGVRSWRKRGPFEGMLTLFPIILLLSTGSVLSGQRVVLVCLPGFVELADLLKTRLLFRTAAAAFAGLQLFNAWQYAHWQFAG